MSKTRHGKIRTLSARFSRGHRIDWHSHSWSQLLYATEGVLTVESRSACWIVPTHRGIWVPAGTEHSLKMHGRVFLQTVYLERHHARTADLTCSAFEIPRLMHELIVHVCDLGIVSGDTKENRTLIQFFTDQLERLNPFPLVIPMPQDERARRLAERIVDAPGSAESLADLSGESGASLRTMQRIFTEEVGVPLSRWRNQVKMFAAIQLLANGRSVTNIAFDLGFESVSAFVCSFRHYFGDSPGQYRSKQCLSNAQP